MSFSDRRRFNPQIIHTPVTPNVTLSQECTDLYVTPKSLQARNFAYCD